MKLVTPTLLDVSGLNSSKSKKKGISKVTSSQSLILKHNSSYEQLNKSINHESSGKLNLKIKNKSEVKTHLLGSKRTKSVNDFTNLNFTNSSLNILSDQAENKKEIYYSSHYSPLKQINVQNNRKQLFRSAYWANSNHNGHRKNKSQTFIPHQDQQLKYLQQIKAKAQKKILNSNHSSTQIQICKEPKESQKNILNSMAESVHQLMFKKIKKKNTNKSQVRVQKQVNLQIPSPKQMKEQKFNKHHKVQNKENIHSAYNIKNNKSSSTINEKVGNEQKTHEKKNILTQVNKELTPSIDDFQLGRKIGRGRFGNVYMVQHLQSKTIFALKVLGKKQIKEQQMQEQIISQIKLQLYLKHPNILKLYTVFDDNQNIYLLLQFAPEGCLFKKIKNQVQLCENRVVYYSKQLIEAMKYIHCQGVIHRDIKPQNLLLTFDVLKLGDFGWATYSPTYKRQTFCGTLDYVCPQIIKGQFYDEKVDIWSLGVLLFEMAAGYAPFEGEQSDQDGQNETFQKILQNNLHFPSKFSPQFCSLISQIIQNNPQNRIDLQQIQNNPWIKKYQLQGRYIHQQFFDFWKNH